MAAMRGELFCIAVIGYPREQPLLRVRHYVPAGIYYALSSM
jgi:hypothetical protein